MWAIYSIKAFISNWILRDQLGRARNRRYMELTPILCQMGFLPEIKGFHPLCFICGMISSANKSKVIKAYRLWALHGQRTHTHEDRHTGATGKGSSLRGINQSRIQSGFASTKIASLGDSRRNWAAVGFRKVPRQHQGTGADSHHPCSRRQCCGACAWIITTCHEQGLLMSITAAKCWCVGYSGPSEWTICRGPSVGVEAIDDPSAHPGKDGQHWNKENLSLSLGESDSLSPVLCADSYWSTRRMPFIGWSSW